jgi:bifunctional oligoribonuclease and PAP phosphatase NrnA
MTSLYTIAAVLTDERRFLLMTHKDPDADGIGSMLALGKSLSDAGKEATLLSQELLRPPLNYLKGAGQVVTQVDPDRVFDVAVVLDCAEKERLGCAADQLKGHLPLINIDHHETNSRFGTLNLIEPESSSTGELVFGLIQAAGFPIGPEVAENLFAAIQGDTGSFRYANTTAKALRAAADLVERGADPWDISRKVMESHSMPRLRLLKMALDTIRLRHQGRIAVMTLTCQMVEDAGAHEADSEHFVDYPRFVRGVEIGALIRETSADECKFSLRSNSYVNAARLASRFGGGGHVRAAGFTYHGPVTAALTDFLREAERFLDGTFD